MIVYLATERLSSQRNDSLFCFSLIEDSRYVEDAGKEEISHSDGGENRVWT
jgi:hypothetical protein